MLKRIFQAFRRRAQLRRGIKKADKLKKVTGENHVVIYYKKKFRVYSLVNLQKLHREGYFPRSVAFSKILALCAYKTPQSCIW